MDTNKRLRLYELHSFHLFYRFRIDLFSLNYVFKWNYEMTLSAAESENDGLKVIENESKTDTVDESKILVSSRANPHSRADG